jgi:hypothetical protein
MALLSLIWKGVPLTKSRMPWCKVSPRARSTSSDGIVYFRGGPVIGLEGRKDFSDGQRRAPFLCECGNSLCPERIWLTRVEYDRLVDTVGLVLAPKHEDCDPLGQCGCGRSRRPNACGEHRSLVDRPQC